MLGWTIDMVWRTIELPPHRIERLHAILDIPRSTKHIPTKTWHKIMGELRSMALALPGARGFFSLLQEAFRHEELDRPRVRLTGAIHHTLAQLRCFAQDISTRPTRIAELIPATPSVTGACDAAGTGMGGVFFFSTDDGPRACLWRHRFPRAIRRHLSSFANPSGSITNSDLELCGNVAHHEVISSQLDIREATIWTGSDNSANIYWNRKGSTTTLSLIHI